MPLNQLFGKLKSVSESTKTNLKNKESVPELSLNEAKKRLKAQIEEKAKIYSYIGMEIYDLHVAGQADLPQTADFCQSLDEVSAEIQALEELIAQRTTQSNVCECGCKLTKKNKFCPSCGKPTPFASCLCTCGAPLERETKFCSSCGKPNQSMTWTCACGAQVDRNIKTCPICGAASGAGELTTTAAQVEKVLCVCGAIVDIDAPMCMECGRRVVKS